MRWTTKLLLRAKRELRAFDSLVCHRETAYLEGDRKQMRRLVAYLARRLARELAASRAE